MIEEATFPETLNAIPFDPPLYDTFAFVSRRGTKISPATRELIRLAKAELAGFGYPVTPPDGLGGAETS